MVVSETSIWTYFLVSVKGAACDRGFVCDFGLDGPIILTAEPFQQGLILPSVIVFLSPAVHIHSSMGRHLWQLQGEQSVF